MCLNTHYSHQHYFGTSQLACPCKLSPGWHDSTMYIMCTLFQQNLAMLMTRPTHILKDTVPTILVILFKGCGVVIPISLLLHCPGAVHRALPSANRPNISDPKTHAYFPNISKASRYRLRWRPLSPLGSLLMLSSSSTSLPSSYIHTVDCDKAWPSPNMNIIVPLQTISYQLPGRSNRRPRQ